MTNDNPSSLKPRRRYIGDVSPDLIAQLRRLLHASGRTQSDIARRADVHRTAIPNFLSGDSDLSVTRFARLVEAAGGRIILEGAPADVELAQVADLPPDLRARILKVAALLPSLDAPTLATLDAFLVFLAHQAQAGTSRDIRRQ